MRMKSFAHRSRKKQKPNRAFLSSVAEVRFSSEPIPLAQNVNMNVLGLGERERERELNGRSRSTAFGSRSEPVQKFK